MRRKLNTGLETIIKIIRIETEEKRVGGDSSGASGLNTRNKKKI